MNNNKQKKMIRWTSLSLLKLVIVGVSKIEWSEYVFVDIWYYPVINIVIGGSNKVKADHTVLEHLFGFTKIYINKEWVLRSQFYAISTKWRQCQFHFDRKKSFIKKLHLLSLQK